MTNWRCLESWGVFWFILHFLSIGFPGYLGGLWCSRLFFCGDQFLARILISNYVKWWTMEGHAQVLFSVTTHKWLELPKHLTEFYMFFLGLPGCREDVAGFGVPVLRSGCSCFPTMGRWGFGRGQNEASGYARKRKLLCPPKCGQIQKGKSNKM